MSNVIVCLRIMNFSFRLVMTLCINCINSMKTSKSQNIILKMPGDHLVHLPYTHSLKITTRNKKVHFSFIILAPIQIYILYFIKCQTAHTSLADGIYFYIKVFHRVPVSHVTVMLFSVFLSIGKHNFSFLLCVTTKYIVSHDATLFNISEMKERLSM